MLQGFDVDNQNDSSGYVLVVHRFCKSYVKLVRLTRINSDFTTNKNKGGREREERGREM